MAGQPAQLLALSLALFRHSLPARSTPQRSEKGDQASDQFCHEGKIQLIYGICRRVVVGISIKCRIRYHYRMIPVVPERGMIAQPNGRHEPAIEWNR